MASRWHKSNAGAALMYGKQKENRPAGQKFSEWVQAAFPGLHMRDASDAQWFAENSDTVSDSCTLGHPRRIREEHGQARTIDPILAETPEPTLRTTLEPSTAARVAKLTHRVVRQAEGLPTGVAPDGQKNV